MLWWLLLTITCIFWLYGFNIINRYKHRHLPGPTPWPFVGNLPEYGPPDRNYLTLQRWGKKYGPIFVWYQGRHPMITISDPEILKEVGLKQFTTFHDRSAPPIVPQLNKQHIAFSFKGMLMCTGKLWVSIRAACELLFQKPMLERYAPLINESATDFLDVLERSSKTNSSVNINLESSKVTMEVISKTVFGINISSIKDEQPSELLLAGRQILKPFGTSVRWIPLLCFSIPHISDYVMRLAVWLDLVQISDITRARRFIVSTALVLLENSRSLDNSSGNGSSRQHKNKKPTARTQLEDAVVSSIHQLEEYQRARKIFQGVCPIQDSLIYRLRNAGNYINDWPLADADICAQSLTFLVAGYETTSLALSYAIYELAKSTSVQQRVQAEVDALVTQEQSSTILLKHLDRLKLTEAVILEAIRLYPPATFTVALNRRPLHKTTLAGYNIYPDDRVVFNIYGLHRDPKYFIDPDIFIPERHMHHHDDTMRSHPYAFIPFGLGPRSCIGQRLAMEETVIVLAKVVHKFNIELDREKHPIIDPSTNDGLKLNAYMTLAPANGLFVKFTPRTQNTVSSSY